MGNAIQKVTVPRATHSGRLKFANVECHVLDNGTRLVTQRGVVAALSGGRESGNLAPYIDRIPNKPGGFDAGAIDFHLKTGQQVGHGIPAVAPPRGDVARAPRNCVPRGAWHVPSRINHTQ